MVTTEPAVPLAEPAVPLQVPRIRMTGKERREQLLECLDRCLQALPPDHRQLFLDYHQDERRAKIDDHLLTDATTVDWGLHDLMIDTLGNELISDVYRINSLRVRLIKLEASTLSPEALLPAMEEHLWFIDALKRRDPEAVAQRLTHHIESAHRRVLGLPRPALPWGAPQRPLTMRR